MYKSYAGIGSRSTPENILDIMTRLGEKLSGEGWTLRSGGATGADNAFWQGAMNHSNNIDNVEIFLPWNRFNNHDTRNAGMCDATLLPNWNDALRMAERYHPAWHKLKQGGRKLQARNCYQVLGQDLDTPAKFIVCWTPGGADIGGTGQALRMAIDYDVRIYNLGNAIDLNRIINWLNK